MFSRGIISWLNSCLKQIRIEIQIVLFLWYYNQSVTYDMLDNFYIPIVRNYICTSIMGLMSIKYLVFGPSKINIWNIFFFVNGFQNIWNMLFHYCRLIKIKISNELENHISYLFFRLKVCYYFICCIEILFLVLNGAFYMYVYIYIFYLRFFLKHIYILSIYASCHYNCLGTRGFGNYLILWEDLFI